MTGAGGFIGTHLLDRLAGEVEVGEIAVVIRGKGLSAPARVMCKIQIIEADILDYQRLSNEISKFYPDMIFHLAGTRPRSRSWGAIQQAYQTNLTGTMNLLRSVQEIPCQSIVLVGSTAEYGRGPAPYQESQPLQPSDPYGASKAAATTLAVLTYQLFNYPVIILRPTLVYGPGQNDDCFMSQLIRSLLSGRHFSMTGGEQYRDFVYVSDVVEALWQAANNPRALGGIFNIGSGKSYPLREVARMIADFIGQPDDLLKIGALPYNKEEQFAYCVDINSAKQVLNWQPKIMLREGIKATVDWFRRQHLKNF